MSKVTMKGFTFGLLSDGELVAATALANQRWVTDGDSCTYLTPTNGRPSFVPRVTRRNLETLARKGLAYMVSNPVADYFRAVGGP